AFQLARTRSDALAGVAIDLAWGATGTDHRFTTNEVDTIDDLIVSPSHEMETGEKVTYRKGEGDAIAPLTDGAEYFVIRLNENMFRLAHTFGEASAGTFIDLTSSGSGTMQGFERDTVVSTFDPTRTLPVVDTVNHTIELPGHGLSTGDKVNYQASGGDPIGGLVDDTDYVVIRVDGDHVQLAANSTDAVNGDEISLGAGATLGSGLHVFRVIPEVEIPEFPDRTIDFDPTLVPALDTDANTIRLPNHRLSTADPLTYLSGSGKPILGLTNGKEYFAIFVNDDTIRLAASAAAANAGTAVDLSGGATGDRHGLQRTNTITRRDPPLRGLNNGETYFAVVLDADHFRLAESEQDALAAAPIGFDAGQGTGTVHSLKGDNEEKGVLVAADLTANNRATSGAAIGSEPTFSDLLTKAELQGSLAAIKAILTFNFKDSFKKPDINGSGTTTNSLFSAAGGLSLNLFDHTVRATLGSTADVDSGGNVTLRSSVSQKSQATAQGNLVLGSAKKFASGVALALGFYTNDVQSIVDGDGATGASIDAAGQIDISSDVEYPLLVEPLQLLPFSSFFDSTNSYDVIGDISNFLNGSLGLTRIMNVWSASKAFTTKEASLPKVAFCGSIGYTGYTNTSQAIVRGGAQLNQNVQNANQKVTVEATTGMELVNVTGIMHLKLNGAGLFKAYKDFDPPTVFNFAGNFFSFFGNKSSTLGVGGSLMVQSMDNTTKALIEDGAAVYSGANGGLEVSSSQDIYSFEFAQSGGESGSIGVSASIVWVDQTSNTIAQLASGVQVTGGPVNVIADDQTTHTSLAGSAQLAKRLGIGVGFALLDADRTTLALIGNRRTDEDESIGSAGTAIDVSSLNLQATSTGDLWSFGLVGALASNIPVGAPDPKNGHAGPVEATSGVALVGDAAVNTITDTTQAYINDDGTIRSGDITLTAHDDTSMSTVTGAGAVGAKPDGTIGGAFAGSFSYNDLDLTTEAFIIGPTIPHASDITLDATSDGSILAVSAGLAGAVAKTSVTVAGSFSWNEIDNTVRAYVDRTLVQQLTNLTLNADDTSTVQADGGAASIAISRAKDRLGGAVAFGVSAAVNNLTPAVQAYITGSTVTDAASVVIAAGSDADVTAITWAGDVAGAASGGRGLQGTGAGAGSGNTITTTVQAEILGGSDVSTAGGDVSLTAVDTAQIEANAGGVAASVELFGGTNVPVAVGAAAAYNEITGGSICAAIDGSTVKAGGELALAAQSEPEIDAQAISVSVGSAMNGGSGAGITLDGAGAGAGNEIGNTTAATITGGSLAMTTGTGDVRLTATDISQITAVAPGISLSLVYAEGLAFSLEVGISITSNEIANTLKANIDGSAVRSGGSLDVQAASQATSNSVPVAAVPTITLSDASSISLSGVGAQAFNTITNDVEASVTGSSDVTATANVNITAGDDPTINANVVGVTFTLNIGGGTVTGNLAIDAVLATNKIGIDSDRNTVRAFVQDSTVTAGGSLTIAATSQPDITGLTVGVGASVSLGNKVSLAASGFGAQTTNIVRDDVEAAILGTSVVSTTGGGKIRLDAAEPDGAKIEAEATGGSLSGTMSENSFAGGVTVGVVLTKNDVANRILAHIDNATVSAGGNIELDANSTCSVKSLTVFVSLAISLFGKASFMAAGDGANSTNTIYNAIDAYILDSQSTVTTTGAGSVLLSATDNSTANAQAGGGNFSLALGSSFGGSISVGAVLATNDIENTVQAYLFNSTVNAAGDVQLTTVSRPKIIATTVAVALSGSGTADGLAATGAAGAAQSKNTISSTVAAHITDSAVTAGGAVTVSSRTDKPASGHNIEATAPAVSVGVAATDPMEGVAFALTGAGGNVINESTSGIQAFIGGSSTVVAAGEVSVRAADATTMDGDVIAVTVALSEIAGSIAVALVTNTHANDVQGYIDQAAVSSTTGAISVTADSSPAATALAVPVAVSVEASGDGANATSDINGSVAAFVDQGATLTAGGGTVTLQATSAADTQADTGGGGLSILLTVSAMLANASIGQTTKSYVSGGSTVTAAGLNVIADSTKARATANVDAVSAALIAGAGGRADSEISGDVIAFVGAESGTTPPAVPTNIQLGSGTLTVRAKAESTTAHADSSGGSGGPTVEVSVLVPFAQVTSDTKAYVGEGTTVGAGALTVDADAHLTANATSLVIGISGFTGDGVNATAKITGDSHTAAFIGPADGRTPSGDTTAITLSGGDASVTATLTGLATTDITVGSGAIVVAADGTTVNSAMAGCVDAYLGDNTHLTTPGDVTVHSTSNSRADATSMGVNAALAVAAAYGTKTTTTLTPTLNAFTGSGVTIAAHDVSVLASHNVDGAGAPLADKIAHADGTAGSGSLVAGGAGANVQGTVAPTIDTRLGAGTTVGASGTVTLASHSYQFADVDANSVGAAGVVAVGVTLATGKSQGTIKTHLDGHIALAQAVVLQSVVTAETDAFGEANGGAIGGAGVGTNVQATVGEGDVDHPLVATYVSGSGQIHSTGDIDIQSLLTTDCVATSSGYAFSGVASVGSLPATSTVKPVVRTRIDAGAQVISSDGNVRVLSGHNYDVETGDFLSDKETLVSTSNTSASIGVKVDDTTVSADANADVATQLADGAVVNATAGQVDIEARSSNLADAHLTNAGGALITFVGVGDAKGTARGKTSAEVLGGIETTAGGVGASNVTVVAQASDIANGQIRQHSGGGISVSVSTAEATTTPTVAAVIGGTIRAGSNINVDADSFTDADATIDNTSGGAINVSVYNADVTVTPAVSATVADNAVLAAGNTIRISSNHGQPAAGLSDGTFNAATQADTVHDTISFTHDHGLQTGAEVTYDALGHTAIGGLGDERTYGVIVTGDKSLQLGDTFFAQEPTSGEPAGINVANDTIVFPAPHNLQGDGLPGTSDRVIYTVPSGSTGVDGLQSGKAYLVSVVDATTVRLVDPDALPAAPLAFAGTNVGGDNQTITIPNHGFESGQAVTYTAPAPAVTSSVLVDVAVQTDEFGNPIGILPNAGADNLCFTAAVMAEQDFRDGDIVIYTAGTDPNTGDPAPISPLVDGERYAVIFDLAKPYEIQLRELGPTGTPIELNPTGVPANVPQTFLKVNDQPIGGLIDGRTYYVANVTSDTFQLSLTPDGTDLVTLDPTDPVTHNVLTGNRNTLGTRGVDLTGVGAGRQHLVIDLTTPGSGTQQLIGIGGASSLAGAPSGDGIATASVSSGGGGVVSVDSAHTTAASKPASTLTVGQAAHLDAASIAIASSSAGNVGGSTDNNDGGFVAVASGDSSISTNNTAGVVVNDSATLDAAQDVEITSTSSQSASTLTDISSKGFAGVPKANATATVDYESKVDVHAATITAGNQMIIDARSNVAGAVTVNSDGRGAGSGSHANDSDDNDKGLFIGNTRALTQTTVHEDASLTAKALLLKATVTSVDASVEATAYGDGLGGNSNAEARLRMTDTTAVILDAASQLTGDEVSLTAAHNDIVVTSHSDSTCDCGGGADNSTAETDYESHSQVTGYQSASITTSNLTVSVDQNVTKYDRDEDHGGGFLVFGDHNEDGDFDACRKINWEATVELAHGADLQLAVDSNGLITADTGVTVTTDTGQPLNVGDTVPEEGTIVVDGLASAGSGKVVFEANVPSKQDDKSPPNGEISGHQGVFSVPSAFGSVQISNASTRDLRIDGLEIGSGTDPAEAEITIDVQSDIDFSFNVLSGAAPTTFTIENTHPTAAPLLIVNGLIDNPIGATTITNASGDIVATGDQAIVRTNGLTMAAPQGNIGQTAGVIGDHRMNVQLVQSAGRPTSLEARAGGDTALSVQGLLRDPAVTDFRPNIDLIAAGNDVDLLLLPGLLQTTGGGGGVSTSVGETAHVLPPPYSPIISVPPASFPVPPRVTTVVDHWPPTGGGPTPLIDLGLQGTGTATIGTTYEFSGTYGGEIRRVQAGRDITFQGCAAAGCGAATSEVSVFGNVVLAGLTDGLLHGNTNGSIDLTEVVAETANRALRVGVIESTNRSVTLTVPDTAAAGEDLVMFDGAVVSPAGSQVSAATSVTIHAGDNVLMPGDLSAPGMSSQINAGTTVIIRGDQAAPDPDPSVGSVIDLRGLITGNLSGTITDADALKQVVQIQTGNNADIVSLTNVTSGTGSTILTSDGNDLVQVGSHAMVAIGSNPPASWDPQNTGGVLDHIHALLTIKGGDHQDTLSVDNSGDTETNIGRLTNSTIENISGIFGAGGGFSYGYFEFLNIDLGSGGDNFTVEGTHAGTTTLAVHAGADTVNIQATQGSLLVDTGGETCVNGISVGSLAPLSGGRLDTIQGQLTVAGNGHDTLKVDDTGSLAPKTGALTPETLSGLGMGSSGIHYSGIAVLKLALGHEADSLTIGSGSALFPPDLTVDGGQGTDEITVNANLILGQVRDGHQHSGWLTLRAEHIHLNASTISTNGAPAAGDVLLDGNVTLGADVSITTDGTDSDGDIHVTGTVAAATQDLTLNAGSQGDLTLSGALSDGGTLLVLDANVQSYQGLEVQRLEIRDATTSVTFHGTVTSATTVDVNSGGTIWMQQPMTAADTVVLLAGTNITFDAAGDLSSTGGSVQVTADADHTGGAGAGAITMADGTIVSSGGGLIQLAASGNVTLGSAVTGGEVQVTSLFAAIVDGGDTDPEIHAARAALYAQTGIGHAGDLRGGIETQTNGSTLTLAAVADRGDIQIHNSGALLIGTADGLSGVVILDSANDNQGDNIVVTSAGPAEVVQTVVNNDGGNITLAAEGTAVTDDVDIDA
ncbi:MAG TPA: hypothetical protein PLF81_05245, partial [Candidatus Anammoximicrobium sp.]|nr:hypothetical protein [Candidatus Anammoximicrobium sp.]